MTTCFYCGHAKFTKQNIVCTNPENKFTFVKANDSCPLYEDNQGFWDTESSPDPYGDQLLQAHPLEDGYVIGDEDYPIPRGN